MLIYTRWTHLGTYLKLFKCHKIASLIPYYWYLKAIWKRQEKNQILWIDLEGKFMFRWFLFALLFTETKTTTTALAFLDLHVGLSRLKRDWDRPAIFDQTEWKWIKEMLKLARLEYIGFNHGYYATTETHLTLFDNAY